CLIATVRASGYRWIGGKPRSSSVPEDISQPGANGNSEMFRKKRRRSFFVAGALAAIAISVVLVYSSPQWSNSRINVLLPAADNLLARELTEMFAHGRADRLADIQASANSGASAEILFPSGNMVNVPISDTLNAADEIFVRIALDADSRTDQD